MAPTVRTSASHPLRIGRLDARLGITIAPGKQALARDGFTWARSLDADLDVLVAERVEVLVCLLETDEMARLGIAVLLAAARHRGLDVIHAPIVDVSVPTTNEANELVAQLLDRGDRSIVIHCNGGLGRSGVVAGCLLRARGVAAEDALRRLREARGPECPQTEEQRAFVRSFAFSR